MRLKKCLVTGGAGFIGSNLARHLIDAGVEVVVLDDLSSGYLENLKRLPEAKFVEGTVVDDTAIDAAIVECDTVFHLAASVGNKRSIDQPLYDSDINVMGTLRILEACRRHSVGKIVFSSSAGIFGELKHIPIRENHPVEPDSPYGASKLCAEKMCLAYAKLYDLEAVCLRYFNVFGPHQRYDEYGNVIPIFAFRILRNEPITIFGDGEQTRDFVNVRDIVQANVKSAQTVGVSGAFNIASGTQVTINHLAGLLNDASQHPATINYGPPRPGDVLHSLADITAAREAFGFVPKVELEPGIKEYMAWAQEELV